MTVPAETELPTDPKADPRIVAIRSRLVPVQYVPITPHPKQALWLMDPREEMLAGGAAGPGKSTYLLMAALQFAWRPGYSAFIGRRTFTDLSQSLIPKSHDWLRGTGAAWNGTDHRWTFPTEGSPATLSFGYFDGEYDRFRYGGPEYQFVGFDELTELRRADYQFMFSRLRRVEAMSDIPLRARATSNPGGRGREWVKEWFVDACTIVERMADGTPTGILVSEDGKKAYAPGRISDNPYLDAESYIDQSLARLDPVTRRQLLYGDWTARQSGGVFKRETIPVLDALPQSWSKVRAWDLAGSEGGNYTVGCLVSYGPHPLPLGGWCVEHVVRGRWTPAARDEVILNTARADGKLVRVIIEQEGGSGGIAQVESIKRTLSGYSVTAVRPTGDKLTRAGPFATQAGIGRVAVVRGPWLAAFLDELEAFPDGEYDDQVDSASMGYLSLPQSIHRGAASVYVPERGPTAFDDLRGMTIGGGGRDG